MKTSRRKFLKNTVTTMAGIGLASALPNVVSGKAHPLSPNDKLVVGLIGCKNMGNANLKDFLKQPNVECAALCDIDDEWLNLRAKEVADATGVKPKLYKDFRNLIENKDLDAIIVGTPDHWHCLPLVYACEAGKDVYVEKPLANTIGECNIMLKAARKYNRVVQVGQQQRSGKHWKTAMDYIQFGNLGKIRRIKIWCNFNYGGGQLAIPDEPVPEGIDYEMWLGPAPKRPFNRHRFHGTWRLFWDYGGGLMTDWGVHLLDMGIWAMNLTNSPKSVMSIGGIFGSAGHSLETPDTQTVLYEFDNFSIVWEHNGGIQTGPYGRNYGLAFIGTNGTLIADRNNWEVLAEDAGEGKKRTAIVPPQVSDNLDHINHVANFIECVKTRQKPAADIEIGRQAALYAHLGNIAFRTGHKIIWSEEKSKIINDNQANKLVTPAYRKPWQLPKI